MKKAIIYGFFVAMILLSMTAFRAVTFSKIEGEHINIKEVSRTLSDKEVSDRGYMYEKGKKHVDYWQIKETYRKDGPLMIEVRRDTLKQWTMKEDCGC